MIYLVEDDDNIRKLVCYALEKEGYEVQGFSTPGEFWHGAEEKIPSLVLLDIMLRGGRSVGTCENARKCVFKKRSGYNAYS